MIPGQCIACTGFVRVVFPFRISGHTVSAAWESAGLGCRFTKGLRCPCPKRTGSALRRMTAFLAGSSCRTGSRCRGRLDNLKSLLRSIHEKRGISGGRNRAFLSWGLICPARALILFYVSPAPQKDCVSTAVFKWMFFSNAQAVFSRTAESFKRVFSRQLRHSMSFRTPLVRFCSFALRCFFAAFFGGSDTSSGILEDMIGFFHGAPQVRTRNTT